MQRPSFGDVPASRRANMRAVRAKDTRPEMLIRRMLHGKGYRFRLHVHNLPGRPDLVFPARRKVVEIRGCFWHRHSDPGCRNAVSPKTRADWWKEKLDANVARDDRNVEALRKLGWSTIVVWECEVDTTDLFERLRAFLGLPGPSTSITEGR